jgi:uncharacterized protein with ATP-grasp and redox domains
MQELSRRSKNRGNSSFISIMNSKITVRENADIILVVAANSFINDAMVEEFMELSRSELISIFGYHTHAIIIVIMHTENGRLT